MRYLAAARRGRVRRAARAVRAASLVAVAVCIASPLGAQVIGRDSSAFAIITYVSGSSIYIDAGSQDGVVEGSVVEVLHRGQPVLQLRVRFVSPRRAQCELPEGAEPPAVGDTVRYARSSAAVVETPDTATAEPASRLAFGTTPAHRSRRLRGRVGLRFLSVRQGDSGSGRLTQPAADVLVEGRLPGANWIGVALDARARRTRVVTIDGASREATTSTLVYQSSLTLHGSRGARLRIGRQFSGELAAVSLFDGAALELERSRFGMGLFAGSQPDVETMGYSTRVREYGGYVVARPTAWPSFTFGAVSSRDDGEIDREFGFLASSWYGRRGALYLRQELDYNRGWKEAIGLPTVSATSTYGWARLRAGTMLWLQGGYDTRRNVRLYRNYLSPELSFDDSFRTGVWGGLSADTRRVTASFDVRRSTGGARDSTVAAPRAATVSTLTLSLRGASRLPFDLRERSSRYSSAMSEGWLHSLSLGYRPAGALNIEAIGGVRRERPAPGTAAAALANTLTLRWVELDADLTLARSWYLLVAVSRERGGWESSDQLYSAISYRF